MTEDQPHGRRAKTFDFGQLLPSDLVDGKALVQDGLRKGVQIEVGRSLFCRERKVGSEREWRDRARQSRTHSTCINIGLATWPETREALGLIYEDALRRGVRPPDRFNLLAERRMGLPPALRVGAPQETGPMLWTDQDWWELANSVPIQPEAGDNMIGGPGSVDNVTKALAAGVTYVGVLTQYSWRWPYWDDEITQLAAVIEAAAILASKKPEGVVFDSYLDDGYPGMFHDYANYIGWSLLERYLCEDLIGVAYNSSWGGLTTDPIMKCAVTLAIDATNPQRTPAAFHQGDTIGNTWDFDGNFGSVSTDVLFSKMVDMRYRLGGAPLAVPVTEVARIPSWQEISAVHSLSRRLEGYIPYVEPTIDWARIEAIRDRLVAGGRAFFRRVLTAMAGSGVDTRDPAQVLYLMKRVPPETWEVEFGAGAPDAAAERGHRPVAPTDLVAKTAQLADSARAEIQRTGYSFPGRRLVVVSTDVHEYAKKLLVSSLSATGATVSDGGSSRDPEDLARIVLETACDTLVITTHNGVARSYGRKLMELLAELPVPRPSVFMGGVLNEDVAGSALPVDVRPDLHAVGIRTPASVTDLLSALDCAVPG